MPKNTSVKPSFYFAHFITKPLTKNSNDRLVCFASKLLVRRKLIC